ncbi:type VI secretion system lipoprotein TssJ [Dechloromonas sp. A34]|uniref:type VI secretion system lipoprotein TssJ n=1 Tax=Dechloromonas sp. A34 TaxID=447588 RepID=UPI002248D68E|nr:type VI secretion system lipoprotein TssJ [Dechloromonas sp. A34]
MSIPRKPRFNCLFVAILGLLAALVSGCSTTSGVQLAGAAIGMVLEATGVIKKDSGDPSKKLTDLSLRVFAGEELNTTSNGKSLSLVMKIYILRSPERLKMLTYPEISTTESEREALGDSLISVREITVIPGKSYDLQLKIPGEATTIGIVGMFRAPFSYRWKLAFDAKNSFDTGIIVGAHACALTASKGSLASDISPDSVHSLIGVQCNQ